MLINRLVYNYTDVSDYISYNNGVFTLDSEGILRESGYTSGYFTLKYKIYKEETIESEFPFFISKTSASRKEIKLSISNESPVYLNTILKNYWKTNFYKFDDDGIEFNKYLVYIDDNRYIIDDKLIVNAKVVDSDLLVKLESPLSNSISEKSKIYIISKLVDDILVTDISIINSVESPYIMTLREPSDNSDHIEQYGVLKNKNNIIKPDSEYYKYLKDKSTSDLINNKFEGIELKIDYTDFSNFIHFGSAVYRLNNFIKKLQNIEYNDYMYNKTYAIYSGSIPTSTISASINVYSNNATDIISTFDYYEKYLYYNSSSMAYPKDTSKHPYVLYSTTASIATDWYSNMMVSASDYDSNNRDYLYYSIPYKIRSDSDNLDYMKFINLTGQVLDYSFVYIKNISNLYSRSNILEQSVPNDLLYDLLKNFGFDFVGNENNSDFMLYKYGLLDNAFLTGSDGKIIADTNRIYDVWNRVYNNIPYILKSKGTARSIRALYNCYGIPNDVAMIRAYSNLYEIPDDVINGSVDSTSEKTYLENTYGIRLNVGSNIQVPWTSGSSTTHPNTIEFKFKPLSFENSTLFEINSGSSVYIKLNKYANEDYTKRLGYVTLGISGSYGQISVDSDILPIYEGDYYSIMLNRSADTIDDSISQTYTLYLKKYDTDLNDITRYVSASITNTIPEYNSYYNKEAIAYIGGIDSLYYGLVDEFRIWGGKIEEEHFNYHVRNSNSIFVGATPTKPKIRFTFNTPINHYYTGSVLNDHGTATDMTGSCVGFIDVADYPYNYSYFERYNTILQSKMPNSNTSDNINFVKDRKTYKTNTSNRILSTPDSTIRNINDSVYAVGEQIDKLFIGLSTSDMINNDIFNYFGNSNIQSYYFDPKFINSNNYQDDNGTTYSSYYWSNSKYTGSYQSYIESFDKYDSNVFKNMEVVVAGNNNTTYGIIHESSILKRKKIKLNSKPIGISSPIMYACINNQDVLETDGVLSKRVVGDINTDDIFSQTGILSKRIVATVDSDGVFVPTGTVSKKIVANINNDGVFVPNGTVSKKIVVNINNNDIVISKGNISKKLFGVVYDNTVSVQSHNNTIKLVTIDANGTHGHGVYFGITKANPIYNAGSYYRRMLNKMTVNKSIRDDMRVITVWKSSGNELVVNNFNNPTLNVGF